MINLAAPLGITVSADCSQRLQVSKMFFFSSFASLAVFEVEIDQNTCPKANICNPPFVSLANTFVSEIKTAVLLLRSFQ